MDTTSKKIDFKHFLRFFPEVELPILLSEDLHHTFITENEPLPITLVEEFIHPNHPEFAHDDMTEFVACFRLPNTVDFIALVYWKAALLEYEYVLVTYDMKGNRIDRQIIGGTKAQGGIVTQRVASIQENYEILIAIGEATYESNNTTLFDATSGETYRLQIIGDGSITVFGV
jgi:hypothetical protein